jgi:hypothetical protein
MAKVITQLEEIQAPRYMSDHKAYKDEMNRFKYELREFIHTQSKCQHAGDIISFPIADGQAQYMVFDYKTLILLPFYDEYEIPDAHARGLRKADIIENITDSKSRKSFIFRRTVNIVMNELVESSDIPFYIKESFLENKLSEELAELAVIINIDAEDIPLKSLEMSFNFSTDEKGFLNGNHIDFIAMTGDRMYLDEAITHSDDEIKKITDEVKYAFRERMSEVEFKTL